jgi:hypothetical protein
MLQYLIGLHVSGQNSHPQVHIIQYVFEVVVVVVVVVVYLTTLFQHRRLYSVDF